MRLIKCETKEKCEVDHHRYGSEALKKCVQNRRFNNGYKAWSNHSNVTRYDGVRGHSLFPNDFHAIPDINGTDKIEPQNKTLWAKYSLGQTSWYIIEMDKNTYDMFVISATKGSEPLWRDLNLVDLSEFKDPYSSVVVQRDVFFKKKIFKDLVF